MELYTYGGGEYMVDITCIPMNKYTNEIDDRISPSMYPAKTVKFYIYEDKVAEANFENESISKQVGDAPFINNFTTTSDGDIEYTSSNPKVAKVNQSTGEVTILGAGEATITAKVNRSYIYQEITKTYTIKAIGEGSPNTNESSSKGQQIPELKFENSNIKKKLGDAKFTNKLNTNTDGKIIYTSGNTLVAKVDKATGEITIVGTGMTTIVATAFETENYKKATATYTLTVASSVPSSEAVKPTESQPVENGQQPVEKKTPILKFASANMNKKVGDGSFTNELSADTDGKIIYTSGNTLVAKVDKNTGKVTIVGPGMTAIVATALESDNYKKGTATFLLKVANQTTTSSTITNQTTSSNQNNQTTSNQTGTTNNGSKPASTPTPNPTKAQTQITVTPTPKPTQKPTTTGLPKTPTLKFESSKVDKKTGDASFTNKLTCDSDGLITYTSSNTSVAQVNGSNGTVTIKGVGTAKITAKSKATSNYKAGEASFTIVVTKGNSNNATVVTKKDATVAFSTTSMTYTLLSMNRNPIYLTVSKKDTDGAITYSSSNESVVKIDSKTGKITLAGVGTARIYAKSAATNNYKAGEGYCDVTVKRN